MAADGIIVPVARELRERCQRAIASIDDELASVWLRSLDPEQRKALSRAREFLQRILESSATNTPEADSAATALVDRVATPRLRRNRDNAWDLAEELRITSYAYASDSALALLLAKERADTTSIRLATVFGSPIPSEPTLEILQRLHRERVERVRHDRARDKLWQQFVMVLIPVIALLLSACLSLQDDPTLLLAVLAGALGSMLSAVLKARDSEQRIRYLRRSFSFVFLQPMIGATAALVTVWIGVANVLNLGAETAHATAVVGFLAGFSEPFFLGTLGRLSDLASANGKSTSAPADELRKKSNH